MYLIKLSFNLENNSIPNDINRVFVSYLKSKLEKYDEITYKQIFSTNTLKKYTFCTKMNSIKHDKGRIILANTSFSVELSNYDLTELFAMYNAFLKACKEKEKYSMNGNSMILTSVRIVPLKFNGDQEVLIKMESPLVVRDNSEDKDRYLYVGEDEFNLKLNESVNAMLNSFMKEPVIITPIKMKKTVVNLYRHKANASLGYLKIEGNADSIYTLLQSGIGSRRSIGMGKFRIVG